MREYQFTNKTIAAYVLVVVSALGLALMAFSAGPSFGMSDAEWLRQRQERAEAGRYSPELQKAVDALEAGERAEGHEAEIDRQAKQIIAIRKLNAWSEKNQAGK